MTTAHSAYPLSQVDCDRAVAAAAVSGCSSGVAAVRIGLVPEEQLAEYQSRAFDVPFLRGDQLQFSSNQQRLNAEFCRHRQCALVAGDGSETLVMADVADDVTLCAVTFALDEPPKLAVGLLSELESLLASLGDAPPAESAARSTKLDADVILLGDQASDAPAVSLANRMLAQAVEQDASDIHVEPGPRHVAIRFRIDGRLNEFERVDSSFALPLVSRLKILSGLDIAETRMPQDGRITVPVKGREIDIRVATSPAAHGETVTLRLLGRGGVEPNLDRLGLPQRALEHFNIALDRPHGIILVTGPTGSGKTTTLYAALSRLNRPETKILTAEDPVEIELAGVNQVQVRPDIDLSYARILRSFLRQDPDVLMVGEIRDAETAEIALRAAMTGHLMLSTLHTNTALGSFARLRDIGAEPFLVASTVLMVAAQRLVRRLCRDCRQAVDATADDVRIFAGTGEEPPASIWSAVGCSNCRGTGYRGRVPVIETIIVDEGLRELIRAGASEAVMASVSLPADAAMLAHGLRLVVAGETTPAELVRAIAFADAP